VKLLIATGNRNKLKEIRAIFNLPGLDLMSIDQVGNTPEVVEDGNSFEINALKKAVTLALTAGLWTMADDSGLEVDVLSGEPGVRSARYAGERADYRANNIKLLEAMRGQSNRTARFRCVIALSRPNGQAQIVEGVCEGTISEEPKGRGGFGYDPLFIPKGYSMTFAEMDPDQKNSISHRGAALRLAREKWEEALSGRQ